MKLPKELTTVTPASKLLAVILFITFPLVGFFLGMRYQEMLNLAKRQQMESNLSIPRIPTPNETVYTEATRSANWKTYTNEKYGFLIRVPSDYVVRNYNDGIIHIASSEKMFGQLSQFITIDARLTAIYKNYDDSVRVLLQQFNEDKNTHIVKTSEKVVIKQGPGKSEIPVLKPLGDLYGEIVYWKFKNGAITASFNNAIQDQAKVYDQILSTFKFTQ